MLNANFISEWKFSLQYDCKLQTGEKLYESGMMVSNRQTRIELLHRLTVPVINGTICNEDKNKNQHTNKKHVYLKNKRFEHIKNSSSVLFLEIKRKVGTYKYLH